MSNMSEYHNQNQITAQILQPAKSISETVYPINAFPPIMRELIQAYHDETHIPAEMIGSTVLAAAAIACQSHINVTLPHSGKQEPCSLYLLTIAESGEGKSTVSSRIMSPFEDFSSDMKQNYQCKLDEYHQDLNIWTLEKKALESTFQKRFKRDENVEQEKKKINDHIRNKPKKPLCLNLLYADTTPKTIIQGLSEYPDAGIILDEAMIFFKGFLKNNLGLLNNAWDGKSYQLTRSNGESFDVSACLTLYLMSQSEILKDYMKKHGETARGSGFFSRFLFTKVKSTIGNRPITTDYRRSEEALKPFHNTIHQLLKKQMGKFLEKDHTKKTLELNSNALNIWRELQSDIQKKITDGDEWAHIRDIVSKASANTLRIAAILQHFHDESSDHIQYNQLESACKIMNWHLHQASILFSPDITDEEFKKDVCDLYLWIKKFFIENGWYSFPKNKLEKLGPNRLRRKDKLTPVLDKLISIGAIYICRMYSSPTLYIAASGNYGNPTPFPPPNHNSSPIIIQNMANTLGRPVSITIEELSRL
ncbi:Uncharacterised protein [Yersinia intermedia]|nr:Uncharacterised protein [Yersinia intermedia]